MSDRTKVNVNLQEGGSILSVTSSARDFDYSCHGRGSTVIGKSMVLSKMQCDGYNESSRSHNYL